MVFGGLSSSVIIALAAVLWLAYLVPTWFKRREYLSTERNAVRLQQTLRILAETAEVPEQVRVENSARGVAAQEKLMQREMQRTQAIKQAQDAAASRAAARTLAETQPAIAAHVARSSSSSRRLRRSRFGATLVMLAALAGAGFGVAQVMAGATALLLVASSVVSVGALVLLRQLAAVSRARAQLAAGLQPRVRVATPVQDLWEQKHQAHEAAPASEEWTPVQVPKPLYLSRSEAPAQPLVTFADAAGRLARTTTEDTAGSGADVAVVVASADSEGGVVAVAATSADVDATAVELREASDRSERALREAQEQTARLVPAEPSRFARMGVIDESELAPANLDEALRRRRAV